MQYPIAIEWGDENTPTGMVIPDIPGASSAGYSYAEAHEAIFEIAHVQLKKLVQQGQPIPLPTTIEHHRNDPAFEGWGWELIDIDISPYLHVPEEE